MLHFIALLCTFAVVNLYSKIRLIPINMKDYFYSQCAKRVVQLVMVYAVLIFCTACVNAISDNDSGEELQTSDLTFRVTPYSLSPMTRATETSKLKTICAVLYKEVSSSNWVKKYETNVVAAKSGTTAIGFSSVVHGQYKLVIIGHTNDNNSNPSMIDVTQITFPEDKIPEFQYYVQDVTVSPTATAGGDVTLKLGVAKLQIAVSNVSELNDYKLAISIDGTATAFNALTGLGKVVTQRTGELDLSNRNLLKINYFLLLMNQEEDDTNSTIKVTLQAKDANSNVVSTETLNNVPAKVGYVTTYNGNLFDGSLGSFNVANQANYGGEYEKTL